MVSVSCPGTAEPLISDRRTMTTNEFEQVTKLFSESTPEQKTALLGELARDLVNSLPNRATVPLKDTAGSLLGYLVLNETQDEIPEDENSPEFLAALQRRVDTEPCMTVDEVLDAIRKLP